MKSKQTIAYLFFMVFLSSLQAQTLFNGIGHIPQSHQLPWSEAGLLNDMSTTTPVEVFVISGGSPTDDYPEVETAIADAKSHVDMTGGLAIIYFLEGTYYLDDPLTLDSTSHNIVFQGAGSDRTTLVFRNMRNEHCIEIVGDYTSGSSWIDMDENFISSSE